MRFKLDRCKWKIAPKAIYVNNYVEALNEGHDLIRRLKDACLLEDGIIHGIKTKFLLKMHDAVRDLAIWIASDSGRKKGAYLSVQAESTLKLQEWEKAERICMIENKAIKELNGSPQCSNLSTLLLQDSSISVISDEFFRFMPMLKVLDMTDVELEKLPTSIYSLSGLQYLELPNYDEDVVLTPGSLASLTKLKMLVLPESCCHWEVEGGPRLRELESLQHLVALKITIGSGPALQRLATSPKLRFCTKHLTIKYCPGITSLTLSPSSTSLLSLENMSRLFHLSLKNCDELEELSVMSGDEVTLLSTLEYLILFNMPKLRIVWDAPQQSFSSVNLKNVVIQSCPQLKDITWLIYAPNLEVLGLSDMDGLEEIISTEFATEEKLTNTFSRLTFLGLFGLWNLKRVCDCNVKFFHLENVFVGDCPELEKLPFNINSVIPQSLEKIKGSKEWWESLEWEDEATESNFAPFFFETEDW